MFLVFYYHVLLCSALISSRKVLEINSTYSHLICFVYFPNVSVSLRHITKRLCCLVLYIMCYMLCLHRGGLQAGLTIHVMALNKKGMVVTLRCCSTVRGRDEIKSQHDYHQDKYCQRSYSPEGERRGESSEEERARMRG